MNHELSRGERVLLEVFNGIGAERDPPVSGEHLWSYLYTKNHCPNRLSGVHGSFCLAKEAISVGPETVRGQFCCCPCPRVEAATHAVDQEEP